MAGHPAGRGVRKAAAYAPRLLNEALTEFRQLNSREARAAFADHWIGLWAREFDEAWPMLYELLEIVEQDGLFKDARRTGREHASFADYFENRVKRPFETWAELESTYHYARNYAPQIFKKSFTVAQRAAALDGKTITKGTGPPTQDEKANDDVIIISSSGLGTSADYLTRRIARDYPDILARMKAGEFRSVRAAALEAGIVPRTGTIRYDDPESAARSLRIHMKPDTRRVLGRLLLDDEEAPGA